MYALSLERVYTRQRSIHYNLLSRKVVFANIRFRGNMITKPSSSNGLLQLSGVMSQCIYIYVQKISVVVSKKGISQI
jgi:hypothetical protein